MLQADQEGDENKLVKIGRSLFVFLIVLIFLPTSASCLRANPNSCKRVLSTRFDDSDDSTINVSSRDEHDALAYFAGGGEINRRTFLNINLNITPPSPYGQIQISNTCIKYVRMVSPSAIQGRSRLSHETADSQETGSPDPSPTNIFLV